MHQMHHAELTLCNLVGSQVVIGPQEAQNADRKPSRKGRGRACNSECNAASETLGQGGRLTEGQGAGNRLRLLQAHMHSAIRQQCTGYCCAGFCSNRTHSAVTRHADTVSRLSSARNNVCRPILAMTCSAGACTGTLAALCAQSK